MNCIEASDLINVFSDGALDARDSALVLGHLKDCKNCHEEWQDLENLRQIFVAVRQKPLDTTALMQKIALKISEEERRHRLGWFLKSKPIALVAGFALILTAGINWPALEVALHRSQPVQSPTVNAENLVDATGQGQPPEPLNTAKLGYELKMLAMPRWQMIRSSVFTLPASIDSAKIGSTGGRGNAIARFDFTGTTNKAARITCYQAPRGWIKASGETKLIGQKVVVTGVRGGYNWALWSSAEGHDYLFVTPSRSTLETVLASASI